MKTGWNWKDFSGYSIPVPSGEIPVHARSAITNGEDLWAGVNKKSDQGPQNKRSSKRKTDEAGRDNKPGY